MVDRPLESRELIAYALLATIVLIGGVTWVVTARKRAARKRRLRGIKYYNSGRH